MRRWRKLVPASTRLHLADVADDSREHLGHSFVAGEPVGADHACLDQAIVVWIVKQLRRRGVEAQNAVPPKGLRRGENHDFVGKPLPDQTGRHARPPFAKNPRQTPPAKKFQRLAKIDAPCSHPAAPGRPRHAPRASARLSLHSPLRRR